MLGVCWTQTELCLFWVSGLNLDRGRVKVGQSLFVSGRGGGEKKSTDEIKKRNGVGVNARERPPRVCVLVSQAQEERCSAAQIRKR